MNTTTFVSSAAAPLRRRTFFGGDHALCSWTRVSPQRFRSAPAFAAARQRRRGRSDPSALVDWLPTAHDVPVLLAENEKLYSKLFLGAIGLICMSFLSTLIVGVMVRANYGEVSHSSMK